MNAIWLGRTLVFVGFGVALGIATSKAFGLSVWWPICLWVVVMLVILDCITWYANRRGERRDGSESDQSPSTK